jgi:hypothetical protein
MAHEQTLDELEARIAPLRAYVGMKVQHVKSGGWYRVVGVHFVESDMTLHFTYETLTRRPVQFSRPIGELLDGRFDLKG